MSHRWCSLCYHSNRDEKGIVDPNELDLHYYSLHRATKKEWPSTKSYQVKFTTGTTEHKPYLYDNIACHAPQSKNGEPIFLQHIKTEKDIITRIQYNKSYALAWYGKPYRSARFNHDWCMSTLWCTEQENLFTVPIEQLMIQYPDLITKLESKHRDIMDDIISRSPAHLSSMTFKHKSFAILREIKRCQCWIRYFLKPVNEQHDSAPNYYQIIANPMDIETLKSLIECNSIKTPTQFCTNLMLIWKNAQEFNPKHHKIHKYAVKCMNESRRLIRKYFPQLYDKNNVNNNTCNNKIASVKYTNKNIRECLLCGVCNERLQLLIGFHTNCKKNKIEWSMNGSDGVSCNKCNRDLCDTSIAYYHCLTGCVNNDHSIFLCEICAGDKSDNKYKYDSKQIAHLPFNGLWVDIGYNAINNEIWYEVITCYQEANRIEYEIVFSSNHLEQECPFGKTLGTIINKNNENENNELRFEIDCDKYTDFKFAKLNIDHSILRFIDSEISDSDSDEEFMQNGTQNVYRKVKPQCKNCNNSEMLFMRKNTIPSTDIASVIYCDIHKDYYERNKGMKMNDKCLSFNAFKYSNLENKIPQIAFYFTCTKCKNFDICAGCMLISVEETFKNKNQNIIKQEKEEKWEDIHVYNDNDAGAGEPPQKRVRCTPSISPEAKSNSIANSIHTCMESMDEYSDINRNNLPLIRPRGQRIRSKTVAKKQNNNNNINNININNRKRKRSEMDEIIEMDAYDTNYKELYLKEKEKNNKLVLELKESNEATSKWKSKYDKLYSKVQGVLLNDMKSSPPPLCT